VYFNAFYNGSGSFGVVKMRLEPIRVNPQATDITKRCIYSQEFDNAANFVRLHKLISAIENEGEFNR
jgi:hypothetical protein